jgi:hypothetical protein
MTVTCTNKRICERMREGDKSMKGIERPGGLAKYLNIK